MLLFQEIRDILVFVGPIMLEAHVYPVVTVLVVFKDELIKAVVKYQFYPLSAVAISWIIVPFGAFFIGILISAASP